MQYLCPFDETLILRKCLCIYSNSEVYGSLWWSTYQQSAFLEMNIESVSGVYVGFPTAL